MGSKRHLPREHAALVAGVPGPLRAILGPCPCQACGQPVYFARSQTRVLGVVSPGIPVWRDRTGGIHGCSPLARARRKRAA
jgi:hypothetical protein